jgi:uroporphyrinogen-III synthase
MTSNSAQHIDTPVSVSARPLHNRIIAIPETRDIEHFATLLHEQGASVLRCPMIAIFDAPDAAPVEAWLRQLADKKIDDLIFITGEGIQRLAGFAERMNLTSGFREGLAAARKFTRGPKPARALTELGLKTEVPSPKPTSEGVLESMKQFNLRGRRVGLQLYGEVPNVLLTDYLTLAGAEIFSVAPYVYAPASHDQQVVNLIQQMAEGKVDAIAFTAATQVRRLADVAESAGIQAQLETALQKTKVAAVGPRVAEELLKQGMRIDVIPQSSFFLRQLVKDLTAKLSVTSGA